MGGGTKRYRGVAAIFFGVLAFLAFGFAHPLLDLGLESELIFVVIVVPLGLVVALGSNLARAVVVVQALGATAGQQPEIMDTRV